MRISIGCVVLMLLAGCMAPTVNEVRNEGPRKVLYSKRPMKSSQNASSPNGKAKRKSEESRERRSNQARIGATRCSPLTRRTLSIFSQRHQVRSPSTTPWWTTTGFTKNT